MTRILHATFDGEVLRPDEKLPLAPNTRVLITVEAAPVASEPTRPFLETALALDIQGPEDWSERLEEYLYGEPAPNRG